MTYEQFVADVRRLVRAPKDLEPVIEFELLPALFDKGFDPAGAVVLVQDLHDGGSGVEED